MIKVGDSIPHTTLMEYSDVEGEACSIGPNAVDVAKASAGKTIALFALPGAFTPTCSAKHVPGYVESFDAFKAAGMDPEKPPTTWPEVALAAAKLKARGIDPQAYLATRAGIRARNAGAAQ